MPVVSLKRLYCSGYYEPKLQISELILLNRHAPRVNKSPLFEIFSLTEKKNISTDNKD